MARTVFNYPYSIFARSARLAKRMTIAAFDWGKTALKRALLHSIHIFDQRCAGDTASSAQSLSVDCWDMTINSQMHLAIQGCDVVALAERYGTPLHVVDKQRLQRNFVEFRRSFATKYPKVEIAYSYKTNPIPGVLRVLHEQGASAEVISEFELWLALRLGVPAERIIYNGPAKTANSLEMAVARNIKLINIDSLGEVEAIDRLAKKYGVRQKVGVRVITSVGWSSQFGLRLRDNSALEAFNRLRGREHVIPCGLHIHLGTGIKAVETYLEAIGEVLQFAEMLRRDLAVKIEYLDFGGGFGVPTVRSFSAIDFKLMENNFPPRRMRLGGQTELEQYAMAIISVVEKYYPRECADRPTIIFEPGRAITSSAQTLLLEVVCVKPGGNGLDVAILNGGKNITMPLGYEYHEIFVASKMREASDGYHSLFGPLCHPADIVFRHKRLPRLESGDIVAVMDAGAYFVPNQMNFSNPRPGVVMVEDGGIEVVREHERFEDIIARDVA